MPGHISRLYNQHSKLQKNLSIADSKGSVAKAIREIIPTCNAESASITCVQYSQGGQHVLDKSVDFEPALLWHQYRQLCRDNNDPLFRIMRLSPHPVALSDLQRHTRLTKRSGLVRALFEEYGYGDALALPVLDREANFFMVLIAGRQPNFGPTNRHLMARVATDSVIRLRELSAIPGEHAQSSSRETAVPVTSDPGTPPPALRHLSLTPRQLEIATWLVAGKSDWEIGEILEISPKTVNFHVENIKRTYGVKSRNQFVAAIVHDGGLDPFQSPSRPPPSPPSASSPLRAAQLSST